MGPKRQLLFWLLGAVAATALLVGILLWYHKKLPERWAAFLSGNPSMGVRLFEKKGCIQCHSVNGWGSKSAPDLGFATQPHFTMNELVTAMWNCAPRMWERMRAERMSYPVLDQAEMAHLFAFLYTARYVDEPGDSRHGQRLFETKACIRCHALRGAGGKGGPDLSTIQGVDTPLVWAQAMWNHAPAMEAGMKQMGLKWPKFEGAEMNDLLSYVREVTRGPRREMALLPADPRRGWKLFQSKCLDCHRVEGQGGAAGPELGPRSSYPPTLVQFAGLMWNHSPEMWRAMEARGVARPIFREREMADLIAFLFGVRYFQPRGSVQVGERLFSDLRCLHCHGPRGEGTPRGPSLRKGATLTTIDFATGLWIHGPKMYRATRELNVPWPKLTENDVGDLVSFLNALREESR